MVDQIRPSQLSTWLTRNASSTDSGVVLDVREPWELQTAAVTPQGFTLVRIPMREVPARVNELDKNQAIACLCHHGVRSLQVANFLAQTGFETVANIAGGIDLWATELDAGVPRY